jgi:hypothetical protein
MAKAKTETPVVEYGEGAPNNETIGNFYKDLSNDLMYEKKLGEWHLKPLEPSQIINNFVIA